MSKSVNIAKPAVKRRKQAKQKRASLNPYYTRQIPYSDEALEKMAQELEEWATVTNEIYINKFWLAKKMTRNSFHHLVGRSERLGAAYDYAKEMIAVKREEKIHKGEADRQTISWRQPIYSDEIKEIEEWLSNLKEKENKAGAGNFVVEQSPVPSSDMVPHKKENE